MPSFLRDVRVRNVVVSDDALRELHTSFMERIQAHNQVTQLEEQKLFAVYVVRFDGRGYRTFSVDEAWNYYKGANSVERVVLAAECQIGMKTNHMVGGQIEIRLDADRNGSSHIIVGGESKDWVEATFLALETSLNRRKNLATSLIRTPWSALLIQLLGVMVGVMLALWLATLSAPLLKGVDYPRAVAFAFWFLVYSNLWTYLQQRALEGIDQLFPNVRLSRSGEHWAHKLLRAGVKLAAIAILLWIFGWLTRWASSVLAPLLTGST